MVRTALYLGEHGSTILHSGINRTVELFGDTAGTNMFDRSWLFMDHEELVVEFRYLTNAPKYEIKFFRRPYVHAQGTNWIVRFDE